MSSQKDWLNSFWIAVASFALAFISQLSIHCTWRRMSLPSWNFRKCKQVAYSVVVACLFVYPLLLYCTLLLLVYFFIHFFILMLLLYFCLFVGHLNKYIIFVFGTFFHHFKNTISIYVTIFGKHLRISKEYFYFYKLHLNMVCSRVPLLNVI